MIPTLLVNEHLSEKILVSRESAQKLLQPLQALIRAVAQSGPNTNGGAVRVDFTGVAGTSPSFVDELVRVFKNVMCMEGLGDTYELVIANPPSRLSSKFEAIARGHGLSVRMTNDGSWCIGSTAKDKVSPHRIDRADTEQRHTNKRQQES